MLICGIDEAGRGPLAGPVVVAAAVFSDSIKIEGVKDSKKLKPIKREYLFQKIIEKCKDFSIQIINHHIIDKINILGSTMLGMEYCLKNLNIKNEIIYIDGNYFKLRNGLQNNYNYKLKIRGDENYFQISAASIIAKVTRDKIMTIFDSFYPEYNFKKNKGYPTKEHIETIKKIGISDIHRKSYCQKYL